MRCRWDVSVVAILQRRTAPLPTRRLMAAERLCALLPDARLGIEAGTVLALRCQAPFHAHINPSATTLDRGFNSRSWRTEIRGEPESRFRPDTIIAFRLSARR